MMEGERPLGNAHIVLFTVLQQFAPILALDRNFFCTTIWSYICHTCL